MVTLPKSVCSPSVGFWVVVVGGALMKRIWSPLGEVRRWRLGSVEEEGRERLVLRIERRRVTML